jgi:hypothetical protein
MPTPVLRATLPIVKPFISPRYPLTFFIVHPGECYRVKPENEWTPSVVAGERMPSSKPADPSPASLPMLAQALKEGIGSGVMTCRSKVLDAPELEAFVEIHPGDARGAMACAWPRAAAGSCSSRARATRPLR